MISEIIEKWIKGILIDGITGNLSGLFDNVNAKVGEIASDVGSTPQAWNSGIFNMLRSLSETVVLPIAAAILALVMCHELIQMITEKNNMHDFDTSMFFRWIFKSAFAILIVSNTWNIVMGVFDATQSVVNQSSGVIIGETSMFGFSYYLLLPLARGTNGNGYSSSAPLLPTPLASDTGDVGKGLDIQISANGSYRKMNKDGKAWTARLSHVVYRMTPTTLEKPYLNPDWVEWLMGFPRKWTDIPFGPKSPPTSRA